MYWLVRHIDWAVIGVAFVLSAMWIGNYIRHPLTERPAMVIINDHYVPPRAPSLGPSIPAPSTFS
jgi:hypothetical protein